MIGIYKITNKINGKCYIGQSVDIKRRWRGHKKDAFWKDGPDYKYPLYRSIRKHGLENFSFDIIEECDIDSLNEKEIYYIAFYKSNDKRFGYNQNNGGQTNSHSLKLTDKDVDEIIHRLKTTMDGPKQIAKEYGVGATTIHNINVGDSYRRDNESYPIRPKLCTLQKGIDKPYEQRVEIQHFCKTCGKKADGDYCWECWKIASRKINRPERTQLAHMVYEKGFAGAGKVYGVQGSTIKKWLKVYQLPCTKEKFTEWYNKEYDIQPAIKPRKKSISEIVKPIEQIDMCTNEVIAVFPSQAAALIALGKKNKKCNHISQVCRGIRKSAYGYFWRYAN